MVEASNQFKKDFKIYEAIENSALGHFLRYNRKYIALDTVSNLISVGESLVDNHKKYFPVSSVCDGEKLIEGILSILGISIEEDMEVVISLDNLEYGSLFYTKEKSGAQLLSFTTKYSRQEIQNIRREFYMKPDELTG